MRFWIRLVFVTVLAGAFAAPALAQKAERREKVKKKLKAMRAYVLTEELGLDDTTAAKVFPILSDYDVELEKVAKTGVELRDKARQAEADGDDKALDKIIDELVANQRKRWDLDEERFEKLRKVLTTKQAAKLLIVLPEIDRQVMQAARRAARGEKADKPAKGKAGKRKARGKAGRRGNDEMLDNPFDGP
jgi:hypothetical protein